MIHISPDVVFDSPKSPLFSRTLRVTYRPGGWFGCEYPKTLKHGWKAFFVAHHGTEKVVVSYRKPKLEA